MDFIDLSMTELYKICRKWCRDIQEEYSPHLVIYIARGGYIIGRAMEAGFRVPLLGIEARRSGRGVKEYCFPLLALLPRRICNSLRKKEIHSGVHKTRQTRHIEFHQEINHIHQPEAIKKILVVDDSIDTGHSMKQVVDFVRQHFTKAEIRIFVLNEMTGQEPIIKADYTLFRNTIMRTPMSSDSREYYKFLKLYKGRYKG